MSTPSPSGFVLHVGVDIAAQKASVAWVKATRHSVKAFEIKLTPAGMNDLQRRLVKLCPDLNGAHVTMEATGNYHLRLAHFLHEQGLAVSVINPIQGKRFAEMYLQRDKNDALDALTLAHFGAQLKPKLWVPPPRIFEEVQQRVVQRLRLVKLHAEMLNRQKSRSFRILAIDSIDARSKEMLLLLKRQIEQIEREIEIVIRQEPDWQRTFERVTSIPGVGTATAAWLMMLTLNFTTCHSPEQLAAFVGLVPRQRQSGTSLNTYVSVGHVGHDDIRQHLYVATMSALRYNPVIKAFYAQVKARRKSHRLACVAATRKLIHIIWAVAKSDKPFDPQHASQYVKPSATDKLPRRGRR